LLPWFPPLPGCHRISSGKGGRDGPYATDGAFLPGLLVPFLRRCSHPVLPIVEKYFGPHRAGRRVAWRNTMSQGTVKWFNTQKGYGFIQPDDGSKDVFVHISAVERSGIGNLNEGQKVNFDLERGQQGKTSAVNLKAV